MVKAAAAKGYRSPGCNQRESVTRGREWSLGIGQRGPREGTGRGKVSGKAES